MVCQIMSEEATHLLAENTAKIKKMQRYTPVHILIDDGQANSMN